MDIVINYWAVLGAAVAAFLIGWAWYSPLLFAHVWMKELGMSMDGMKPSMQNMAKPMVLGFIQQLITAYVLARVAVAFGTMGFSGALELGLWVWLGFLATTVLAPVLWEKRSWTWYAITAGQLLVSIVVMSLIIVYWM